MVIRTRRLSAVEWFTLERIEIESNGTEKNGFYAFAFAVRFDILLLKIMIMLTIKRRASFSGVLQFNTVLRTILFLS